MTQTNSWNGPSAGPNTLKNKKVIVLAADMNNGGIAGVTLGIEEAAEHIGWQVEVIDGHGDNTELATLSNTLHTMDADGFVINGFNAFDDQAVLQLRKATGKPLVSWHSTPTNGPDSTDGIFVNITTDAFNVAELAAEWVMRDAGDNQAGVIIITDSSSQFALDKANNIRHALENSGCAPLDFLDIAMAEAESSMTAMAQTMWEKHGRQWQYTVAINDLYFDYLEEGFKAAGIPKESYPVSISGGDGSPAAYERIHQKAHQQATIAEPLLLQGWQAIDELNRALCGEPWSGLVTASCVISSENILADVSIDEFYDPANKYRDAYLRYWLKNSEALLQTAKQN